MKENLMQFFLFSQIIKLIGILKNFMLLKGIFLTNFLCSVYFLNKQYEKLIKNCLVVRTTSNYLSFETNLASVAQAVYK